LVLFSDFKNFSEQPGLLLFLGQLGNDACCFFVFPLLDNVSIAEKFYAAGHRCEA
jgi:hypothetical protein